ncbi:MAG: hypothetical protein ACI4SO_04185 [Muribaculaceae bacterium]
MTKKQYDKFIKDLEKRGYIFREYGMFHDAPNYCRAIELRADNDGKVRAVCQLLFNLYDFSGIVEQEDYSYEPVIIVSRNTDERIDLTLSHPKLSIDGCERIASEFLKFVDNNIKQKGGKK